MSDWSRYLLTTRSLPFFHLLQLDNLDDQLGGLLARGRPPRSSSLQNRFLCLISYGCCLLQYSPVAVQSNGLPPLFYTTLDKQCRTFHNEDQTDLILSSLLNFVIALSNYEIGDRYSWSELDRLACWKERLSSDRDQAVSIYTFFYFFLQIAGFKKVWQHPQCIFWVFLWYCTSPTQQERGKAGAGATERGHDLAVSFFLFVVFERPKRCAMLQRFGSHLGQDEGSKTDIWPVQQNNSRVAAAH